jgi:hypothetical protein
VTFKVWGTDKYIVGEFDRPSMTMLPNGGYVAIFSQSVTSTDRRLHLQIVDGNGQVIDGNGTAPGTWTRVAPGASGSQLFSDIQVLSHGSFVVTWSEASANDRLFSRKYSITGTPIGEVIEVNAASTLYQVPEGLTRS